MNKKRVIPCAALVALLAAVPVFADEAVAGVGVVDDLSVNGSNPGSPDKVPASQLIDEAVFIERRDALIDYARKNAPTQQLENSEWAVRLALLDLFQNRNVEKANRAVVAFCEADHSSEYVGKTYVRNNGTTNLNPEYTFSSPYLRMKHGSNKAVMTHPKCVDLILTF